MFGDATVVLAIRVRFLMILAFVGIFAVCGCTKSGQQTDDDESTDDSSATSTPREEYDLELPMVEYTWDPQAGDPSVSAEDGGPGFTGEGWQTKMKFYSQGYEGAVRGGMIVISFTDWPATLRVTGKDSNSSANSFIYGLCHEGLLSLDPVTREFIPSLATHWWISEDKMTYRYRINPAARFSDGKEVTAADVVATHKLLMDSTLLYPMNTLVFGKFETPVAKSKYIVEVKCKEENWRNFLYFSASMEILPAHQISITGTEYLDTFQFRHTATTGPYILKPEDIVTNQSITVRRRDEYWNENNPANVGLNNIESFKIVIVKEPNLMFEKVKKGEIDFFYVRQPKWWAEELDGLDIVQRGLLLKRRFFTDAPFGTRGLALNMEKPELKDIRMRKALSHLMDRKTMIDKFFFGLYERHNSYYQGRMYQNPKNKLVEYDEIGAVELLEEMGWNERNKDGYRVKDGKELRFKITYYRPDNERELTVYQTACKRAGIRIELEYLTPAAAIKNIMQREYDLANIRWTGLVFPNPETSFHGSLAGQKSNNNITSFKNDRVDELCKAYDEEYDVNKRIDIIREIDGIIYNEHPYVLTWYEPSQPVVFWNKFGTPPWGTHRTADGSDAFMTWWIDPEKERLLAKAKKDKSIKLPRGQEDQRFWQVWNDARAEKKKTVDSTPGN